MMNGEQRDGANSLSHLERVREITHPLARPENIARIQANLPDAERGMMELTADAECSALATSAVEDAQPSNTLETMLIHEMTAAHSLAMRFIAKSEQMLAFVNNWQNPTAQQMQSVEASRMAGSAARLMKSVADASAALQRLQNGGQQFVTVQYVNVADGGQAVVGKTVVTRKGGTDEK